jgi:dynein heavy chain, axonemal
LALAKVNSKLAKIKESLTEFSKDWYNVYYDLNAHLITFPPPFDKSTHLQRLCILKVLRPDRVTKAVIEFVKAELGENFT